MEITPDSLPHQSIYKLMIGAIVPRPIGWISSIDAAGRANLAPYSFFNAVCPNPPTVLFCSNVRGSDHQQKDTINNIRETGEFVVNIVTEELAEAMNLSSAELPRGEDEFRHAGLTAAPSQVVKPPRVKESPIHFECQLSHVLDIGEGPGGGSIVIGQVVHIHVDDRVLIGQDKIDLAALKPIGRLAGSSYTRVTDLFELMRPIVEK